MFIKKEKKMNRKVYWNGKFIDESEAKVSIYDSSMMFGDTVFEMTRSFNKKQFKLKEHIDRLYESAKYIYIDIPLSKKEMVNAVYEVIERNDPVFEEDDEHRIMINITRGLLSIYQNIVGLSSGPNVIISDFPLRWTTNGMSKLFNEGINAIVPSQRAIPSRFLESKVKNRNRIHYLMANIEASRNIGENIWPILFDENGYATEGPGSNFFIIKDKVIISPEGRNILRGISRQFIFDLCEDNKIKYIKKNIELYDIVTADEAFFSATPFCILPCVSINGILINNGKPGPIYETLIELWGSYVNLDIRKQIQKWDKTSNKLRGTTPYQFGGKKC
jgi:branched-chain amino acid aminotransferase